MYDELVKELRSGYCETKLLRKAADALEERDKAAKEWEILAESWKKGCKGLESRMPRWVPVTERLPREELCFYLCYTDEGVIVECLWTNNKFGLGPFGEWGWRLMDIPQHQRITHWMPLPPAPDPPKEEA